jgi:hypothetical protein
MEGATAKEKPSNPDKVYKWNEAKNVWQTSATANLSACEMGDNK